MDTIYETITMASITLRVIAVLILIIVTIVLVQRGLVKRKLWAAAFIISIVEIILLPLLGIIMTIYTFIKWRKRNTKKDDPGQKWIKTGKMD